MSHFGPLNKGVTLIQWNSLPDVGRYALILFISFKDQH